MHYEDGHEESDDEVDGDVTNGDDDDNDASDRSFQPSSQLDRPSGWIALCIHLNLSNKDFHLDRGRKRIVFT